MTRPLEPATSAAFDKTELPVAAILYLDIEGDVLQCWTGIGDLTFGAAETGDPSLDGKTFLGTSSIIEISSISEGAGGSDALEIAMPGVDIDQPLMKQLIRDNRRWQFRRAVAWFMALDPDTFAIAGKPFRIKTGRMDKMPYVENKTGGTIKVTIEGQQSYGNEPLGSRYSEQIDINPADTSQKYVHSLANMTPALGQVSSTVVNNPSGGGAGGGGFRTDRNNRIV